MLPAKHSTGHRSEASARQAPQAIATIKLRHYPFSKPMLARVQCRAPEVHYIEPHGRTDMGQSAAGDDADPVRPGAEDAADKVIANLGRGHVDHAGKLVAVRQFLHGAAADARSPPTFFTSSEPGSAWNPFGREWVRRPLRL
jgi:hypothetical protein